MSTRKAIRGTFMALVITVGFGLLLGGCKKDEETEVGYPVTDTQTTKKQDPNMRPVVPVPPINEYGWVLQANIRFGRDSEKAAVQDKMEDYYSGYPSFLKVLKLITRDRNVGLKDNPAYLNDVFDKYYELVGADPGDPFLAVGDYDKGVLKNALYLSWKKNNEFSPIDNYDDMVTNVDY
jgi:hypothetical protein